MAKSGLLLIHPNLVSPLLYSPCKTSSLVYWMLYLPPGPLANTQGQFILPQLAFSSLGMARKAFLGTYHCQYIPLSPDQVSLLPLSCPGLTSWERNQGTGAAPLHICPCVCPCPVLLTHVQLHPHSEQAVPAAQVSCSKR